MKHLRYPKEVLNFMSQEEIKEYREQLLRNQLKYCFNNSEFYQRLFKEAGFMPDDIKSFEDFRSLPILMNKDIERESQRESMERLGHPFGMHLCCQPQDIEFTGTTSGTTGIPTFTYTLSSQDLNLIEETFAYLSEYVGIYPGDRVLFAHALGIYATTCTMWGLRARKVLPIDVDVRAGAHAILAYTKLTKPHAAMMTLLWPSTWWTAPQIAGINMRDFKFKALLTVGEIGIGFPK